jgi:hypothetical protein
MDVGAADRRGGDAHECVERADIRHRLLVEHDPPGLDEHGGSHLGHEVSS